MKNYFTTSNIWNSLIIEFLWPVEQENIETVFRQIEKSAENPYTIIDLWAVSFLNSTFIWYLYHIFETRRKSWNFTYICNAHPKIIDALNLTWVFDIIPYFKTLSDALKNLK